MDDGTEMGQDKKRKICIAGQSNSVAVEFKILTFNLSDLIRPVAVICQVCVAASESNQKHGR